MSQVVGGVVRALVAHPMAVAFLGGVAVGMLLERLHVIVSRRERV